MNPITDSLLEDKSSVCGVCRASVASIERGGGYEPARGSRGLEHAPERAAATCKRVHQFAECTAAPGPMHHAVVGQLLPGRPGEPCARLAGRHPGEAGAEAVGGGTRHGLAAMHQGQCRAQKRTQHRTSHRDSSHSSGAKVSVLLFHLFTEYRGC